MFHWSFIGLIGYFYVRMIYCQDPVPVMSDFEQYRDDRAFATSPPIDDPFRVSVNHTNNFAENEGLETTTPTEAPEPFACYTCTNCKSKSDFVYTLCAPGITTCYTMGRRIDNTSEIIYRGCSTLKDQCTAPTDDQSNALDRITCCTGHTCNQATQFQPLFFLSLLNLISFLHT